ncbi:hypothetical protein [Vreelandella sp. TE19]
MQDLYHGPIFYFKTNAWEEGVNDEDAYKKIIARVEANESDFLALKSWYLALGKGCDKDVLSALDILNNDALNRNAGALCAVGVGFLRGYYGEEDEEKALYFFDKAEKICFRKANYQKGLMRFNRYYFQGKREIDKVMARSFFEKAARNGHATSLSFLVFCREGPRFKHIFRQLRMFFIYLLSRSSLSGPERWWCYRELRPYRPTAVSLAENCGHALGYFAKN